MKIVGLTGGIGSGKTTVANMFAKFDNVAIYIADKEAKLLMQTSLFIKEKIIEEFGYESFVENQLNRKFIADLVFKNKEKLKKLNAIVHPEVRKHFQEFIKNNADKSYIIYEAAILFESKSDALCDVIITVYVDESIKINRVLKRDNTSKEEVLSRIKNQLSDTHKKLQSNYIIYNKDLNETASQVQEIHNILTQKS